MTKQELTIIGRAERIAFVDYKLEGIPAKIDTGADYSSVWASSIVEKDDSLSFVFFAPGSPYYKAKKITVPAADFTLTRIANSFGQREYRYKVKFTICVQGRTVRATFTLADRQDKLYPVLLGRTLLNRKFLVDVSKGEPLLEQELKRAEHFKRVISTKSKRKAE